MSLALASLFVLLTLLDAAVFEAAPTLTIKEARVAVTGHDVNRPDPYPGIGKFGWAGNVTRLPSGELMLVHSAGYYHVSFAEPRKIEPETRKGWLAEGWPLDFPAPTGGRSMRTLSSDGGKTWSKPETIVDLRLDDAAYGVLRCRDGTLLTFINVQASWYGYYPKPPPEFASDIDGQNTKQCLVRSTDNGKSWGPPIWLASPPNTFYERSHAQPIELPDGGILWPCYAISRERSGEYAVIHRSDDSGKTWRIVSTYRRQGKILDEPAITRLADGRILMICRPDGGLFYSDDNAVSWTEGDSLIKAGRFKAPRLFVMRDGTVVCVATLGTLRVWIGKNGGQSWTAPIALDPSSYGYPGGVKLEDESFLISYCSSGRAPNRIYVVRFKVNEARDGVELVPLGAPVSG